jgi:hypothetical protein
MAAFFITLKTCFNFTTENRLAGPGRGVRVHCSGLLAAPSSHVSGCHSGVDMSAAATRGLTASAAGLRAVLLGNFNAVRLLSSHDSE